MKKQMATILVCLVGVVAFAAGDHFATAGIRDPKNSGDYAAELLDPVPVIASGGAGLNYMTGFEPGEGFALGYIGNDNQPAGCGGVANPCWGVTSQPDASLVEGHIDTVHPFAGVQHLRISHDPLTRTNRPNFGLGVDARFPRTEDLTARPLGSFQVSIELAINAPGGQNFRIQPQSNSQSLLSNSALFSYSGAIYILDDVCGWDDLSFQPTGHYWDTTGAYQNYTVEIDPFTDVSYYTYGGVPIYYSCVPAGNSLEQLVVFGDNYSGSTLDVDNVVMYSTATCRWQCGNGFLEAPCEECEPYYGDSICPGRCRGPGQPGECTCAPTCTQAAPCEVGNGITGPFINSDGWYVYSGASPFVSIDTCASNHDTVVEVSGGGTGSNDNCNNGQFGAGSDTTASCYEDVNNAVDYPSCTCVSNSGTPIFINVGSIGLLPGQSEPTRTFINIRKKSVCEGDSVGACCDTNGADQGCTDNVAGVECAGADKVWTDQGKCDEVVCACIPDCNGAECGDDGCGEVCGTCDDGNICNGSETCNANRTCDSGTSLVCNDGNACNGSETCNPGSGCRPGTPLVCSDGNACNGMETCNPSSGCVSGTPVICNDGRECSVDTCNPADGSCTNDDSDCSIPAVGEWGLVVLVLVFLVAAKVQFGRISRVS